MRKIITNYRKDRYDYPLCDGNDREGWDLYIKNSCRESNEEFFIRLVRAGYSRISFYEVTTRVRGLHEIIAYVKE